jgi:hypothetical protein
MHETKRHKMTINGEPVAEIDIKVSQLTIYHTMVGEPLQGFADPYARARRHPETHRSPQTRLYRVAARWWRRTIKRASGLPLSHCGPIRRFAPN